jgi:hypothetical protein
MEQSQRESVCRAHNTILNVAGEQRSNHSKARGKIPRE